MKKAKKQTRQRQPRAAATIDQGQIIASHQKAILRGLSKQREMVRELLEKDSITLDSIEIMLQQMVCEKNTDVPTIKLLLDKAREKTVASGGRFCSRILYNLLELTISSDHKDEVSSEIAGLLLNYDPVLVHEIDLKTGMSALHVASAEGKVRVVSLLLERGAAILLKNQVQSGFTPLDYAAGCGQKDVVERLLLSIPKGLDISNALYLSAQHGHLDVVKALLKHDPSVVNRHCPLTGLSALHTASATGRDKIVTLLLESGLDVSFFCDGHSTLALAAQGGHTEVVKILQKEYQKRNLSVNNVSLLYIAIGKGHAGVLEILLQGADDNIELLFSYLPQYAALFMAPLHVAVEAGHLDIVERLIRHSPAQVNVVDKYGRTPLHIAAQGGHVAITRKLLEYGANSASVQDRKMAENIAGFNPEQLMHSFLAWSPPLLLEPLEDGKTPLEIATQLGHKEVIQVFLEYEKEKILTLLLPVLQLSNINKSDVIVQIENGRAKLSFRNTQKAKIFLKSLCIHFSGEVIKAGLIKNSVSLALPIRIGERRSSQARNYAEEIHQLGEFFKRRFDVSTWHIVSAMKNRDDRDYTIQYYGNKIDLNKLRQTISDINNPSIFLTENSSPSFLEIKFPETIFKDNRLRNSIEEKLKPSSSVLQAPQPIRETTVAQLMPKRSIKLEEAERQRETAQNETHRKRCLEQKWMEMAKNGLWINLRELLEKEKMDVNLKDESGRTALHYAVQNNFIDMMNMLIEFKADVDVKSNAGNTPLHGASLFDVVEAAAVLIASGANVNATNNQGKTALQLALGKGHGDIVALLEPLAWSKEEGKEEEKKEEVKKEISEPENTSYSLEATMQWMDFSVILHSNSAFFHNGISSNHEVSSSSGSSSNPCSSSSRDSLYRKF